MKPRPLPPQVVVGLRGLDGVLKASARALDGLPPSPKAVRSLVISADRRRRQRIVAARSPRWSELESRMDTDGVLGHIECLEMEDIESSIAPQPAWVDRTHGLNALSLERLVCSVSRAVQRAWRGWSDEDLWSLDQTLCQTLGAQLIALAQQTNGSPGGGEGGFDEWRDALHHHGRVLVTLGEVGLPTSEDADDGYERQAAVRRSLLWVVDHLESLWW